MQPLMLNIVAIILLIITLPGTLELLFLTLSSLLKKQDSDEDVRQTLTDIRLAVVIPAHNEESGIESTLRSFFDCEKPLDKKDIYVIADNCDDQTAAIAKQNEVSVMERFDESLRGKGYALNFAFAKLIETDKYDGFMVVDADSRVNKGFVQEFRKIFSQGADAAQCSNLVDNHEINTRTRLMNIAIWANNIVRLQGRESVGLSVGILGNGFGLSAHTLRAIPYESYSIVEDLEYHLRLIEAGKRVRFIKRACVYSVTPVSGKEAETQRVRWEGGRFSIIKSSVPALAKKVARGKLRFLEPLAELVLLPLAYHVALLFLILICGSGITFLYGIFGLTTVVLHICVAFYLGGCDRHDFFALCKAPLYIFWKLTKIGKIFKASSKKSGWRRLTGIGLKFFPEKRHVFFQIILLPNLFASPFSQFGSHSLISQ